MELRLKHYVREYICKHYLLEEKGKMMYVGSKNTKSA